MNKEKLELRRAEKKQLKEYERIEAEKNQFPVRELTMTIEWKKSKTWGNNPHAEVKVNYHNGTYDRFDGFTCSGCGYDKESTVISDIFNKLMKYKLWKLDMLGENKNKVPYGIACYLDNPHYSGGVGTSCYRSIAEFIGGKFEHIASGKTFDVYKYTDND